MRREAHHEGAAAIEFAFLLPLLVLLAFGITETSTAYNRLQAMQAAAREGARTAAAGADATAVDARVVNGLVGSAGFPSSAADVATQTDVVLTGNCTGLTGEVTVTASINAAYRDDYGITIPLLPGPSPRPMAFTATATFPCVAS